MPQRMLHLLHVVTAFMAKWLAGHGHLTCISLSFWVSSSSSSLPSASTLPLLLLLLFLLLLSPSAPAPAPSPFAVACHVQAIRMFQKCFRHGPLSVQLLFLLLLWLCPLVLIVAVNYDSTWPGLAWPRVEAGGVCGDCVLGAARCWGTYLSAYLKINVNSFIYFLCQIKRFKGYMQDNPSWGVYSCSCCSCSSCPSSSCSSSVMAAV